MFSLLLASLNRWPTITVVYISLIAKKSQSLAYQDLGETFDGQVKAASTSS